MRTNILLETDRYRFVETDTDIFKKFSPLFGHLRYSIGHQYRYSKICSPI